MSYIKGRLFAICMANVNKSPSQPVKMRSSIQSKASRFSDGLSRQDTNESLKGKVFIVEF